MPCKPGVTDDLQQNLDRYVGKGILDLPLALQTYCDTYWVQRGPCMGIGTTALHFRNVNICQPPNPHPILKKVKEASGHAWVARPYWGLKPSRQPVEAAKPEVLLITPNITSDHATRPESKKTIGPIIEAIANRNDNAVRNMEK